MDQSEADEALLDGPPPRRRRAPPPRLGWASLLSICFATLSIGVVLQALNGSDCKTGFIVLFGGPVLLVLQVTLLPTLVSKSKGRRGNGVAFVWVSVAGVVAAVAAMVADPEVGAIWFWLR